MDFDLMEWLSAAPVRFQLFTELCFRAKRSLSGEVEVSNRELARIFKMDKNTVKRLCEKLKELGGISVETLEGKQIIKLPMHHQCTTDAPPMHQSTDYMSGSLVSSVHHQCTTDAPPMHQNPEKTDISDSSRAHTLSENNKLINNKNNININNINNNILVGENDEKPATTKKRKLADEQKACEKRRKEFYQSLVPYVEEFGKTMVREFYDFWSELSKSKTKMRWEQQPTWETKRRLQTWRRREEKRDSARRQGSSTSDIIIHEDEHRYDKDQKWLDRWK